MSVSCSFLIDFDEKNIKRSILNFVILFLNLCVDVKLWYIFTVILIIKINLSFLKTNENKLKKWIELNCKIILNCKFFDRNLNICFVNETKISVFFLSLFSFSAFFSIFNFFFRFFSFAFRVFFYNRDFFHLIVNKLVKFTFNDFSKIFVQICYAIDEF